MSEWISVEDRLPETSSRKWIYDVCALDYKGRVIRIPDCRYCNGRFFYYCDKYEETVEAEATHWMLTPKLPQEGK